MKTFKDLVFKEEDDDILIFTRKQAICLFDNGYGISVVRMKMKEPNTFPFLYFTYTNNDNEWEAALIGRIGDDFTLLDEPVGHLKEDDVTKMMIEIQNKTHNKLSN